MIPPQSYDLIKLMIIGKNDICECKQVIKILYITGEIV